MLKIRIKKFFKKFEIGGILESSEKRNNFHKVLLSIYKDIKRYIEKPVFYHCEINIYFHKYICIVKK